MLSFKAFFNAISVLSEATMKNTGSDAEKHAEKYITPYVGQKGTHTLKTAHGDLEAGTKLTVHGYKVIDGKHHAVVSKVGGKTKHSVPFSKINKPTKAKNRGFDFETGVVSKLNAHGLMHGGGAGFTGGNDFHLINKKTKKVHKGKMAETAYQGETKKDLSAAFGQASLTHTHERGWHFSEKAEKRFPQYTAAIKAAKVTDANGKTKSLIKHINDTYGPPNRAKKSSTNIYSDATGDLHPMHAYLADHHVDVLHVGSHGTFRAGLSAGKDRTGVGFPKASGNGRFRVRQKHANSLTVQFNVKNLDKSSMHIENDEDLKTVKKKLGHE